MRKLFLGTILSITTISSFAAPQGTLLLQGTINQVLSLTVTPESGVNTSLDLTSTQTDLKVAEVGEQTNSNTGYKILIRTANGGSLKNGSFDEVSYTMKYDGSPVTLSTSDTEVKNESTGGVYDHSSDVEISYTGQPAASLTQGTYSDTVTFTIQVN
ncbi:fimbrial protein [Halobacteriovorax marinus]|uniref:fimbrial protein n=1 Tax=Halobacteriovorax marinus TaxID=97084 RepID=UPI000BC2D050|nr:fimbrial protein [Halobacteriovorax marinus]ATH07804.1 fimbrial protein [Halobacteriovorax marinus]